MSSHDIAHLPLMMLPSKMDELGSTHSRLKADCKPQGDPQTAATHPNVFKPHTHTHTHTVEARSCAHYDRKEQVCLVSKKSKVKFLLI